MLFVAVSFIAVAVFVIFFICSCFLNLSVSDSGMPHHNFFCQALQTDVLSHGLTGFYNRVNRHENRKLNRKFHLHIHGENHCEMRRRYHTISANDAPFAV